MKVVEDYKLPSEIAKRGVKPQLLAQAVRVHLANQRQGTQSALTRAEVSRTRKKLYKQKGTGGARHGDRKAPIFVGGGISFAPKPRDYSLSLGRKMRDTAILGALSLKSKEKKLVAVSNLDKATGKTKELVGMLDQVRGVKGNPGQILIVTDGYKENVYRAGRNIAGVVVLPANQVNTYEILKAGWVVVSEGAIEKLMGETEVKGVETKVKKVSKVKVRVAKRLK